MGQDNSVGALIRLLARHSGALAKACESLDHMEAFPFRSAMRDSNLALFKLIVAAGAARGLPLEQRYRERLRVVEERSIFDRHLQSAATATAAGHSGAGRGAASGCLGASIPATRRGSTAPPTG